MDMSKAQVLYDGQCPFCRRSVALLKRLDWLGRLSYIDARDRAHLPAGPPSLDPNRLLQEMHVVTPDGRHVYQGFGALRWLAWRLPLLWPVAPLLYLPGVPALGQRLYLWVARNRFRLVPCHGGVCAGPPKNP
jgi:predicted DCC family thiol-disulfide oxidoreductase YuxK